MAFLDWIKDRAKDLPKLSEKERAATRELFAEWKQDRVLAKQRDETGREPESVSLEVPAESKSPSTKVPAKRERLNDHDIPF